MDLTRTVLRVRPTALVIAALALLVGTLISPGPVSAEDAESLTNETYRVRLKRPGPRWQLLDEDDARKIVPDSILGAMRQGGVYAAVIVEEAPSVDARDLAQVLADGVAVEDKVVSDFTSTEFGGEDSVQFDIRGRLNGISFRYFNTVVMRRGHGYQFIQFGPSTVVRESDRSDFLAAVEFLEGDVRAGGAVAATVDQTGLGWRVKNGVFESSTSRVRVRPAAGWRLIAGVEATQLSGDAHVGLMHATPAVYMQVLEERAPTAGRIAFARALVEKNVEALLAERVGKPRRVTIGGVETQTHHLRRVEGLKIDYYLSVFCHLGRCYQVMAWHLTGSGERGAALIPQAFGAIEFLGEDEAAALRVALLRSDGGQVLVDGPDVVRGRRYWNFDHGVEWTAPAGFWSISAGTTARLQNAAISAMFEDCERGTLGQLVLESADDFDGESYHEAALHVFAGHDRQDIGETRVEGPEAHPFRRTSVSSAIDGTAIRWEITTTVRGPTALQVVVWELEGDPAGTRRAADGIVAGLRIIPGMRAVVKTAGTVTDSRFGFQMRLPAKLWRYSDQTPAIVSSGTTVHTWRSGPAEVFVLGFVLQDQDAAQTIRNLIEHEVNRLMGDRGGVEPTAAELTIGGDPAQRTTWKSKDQIGDVVQVQRGRRAFAIGFFRRPGTKRLTVDEVIAGFRVLD